MPKNSSNSIKDSLFFFGSFQQDLSNFGDEYSGGKRLLFDAVAFWNSAINPKEHRGVIVRVNDASGNTFDSTFLGYQVSEQTRLRQITFEINVFEGLDAAINIDRESFNYAHPHYQIIKRWVHSAIRQIVNRLKKIASQVREENKFTKEIENRKKITQAAHNEWRKFASDTVSNEPPKIKIIEISESPDLFENQSVIESRMAGEVVLNKNVVLPAGRTSDDGLLTRVEALTKVLHAFGVFEEMDYERQQELIRAITNIFTMEE